MISRKVAFIPPQLRPYVSGSIISVARQAAEDSADSSTDPCVKDVVVFASTHDSTAAYFTNFVKKIGVRVKAVDYEDPNCCRYVESIILRRERGLPGIYYRSSDSDVPFLANLLRMVHDGLAFYPGVVINRPSARVLNGSKPQQTASFFASGLDLVKGVPTRITNRHFHPSVSMIVKSISSVRSEVVLCNDPRLGHNQNRKAIPTQYQNLINGRNVRCHICGDVVIACEIHSSCIDYREDGGAVMVPFNLPSGISDWAKEMARRECLTFAGVDLIVDHAGQWWCFEINPEPGYHYFERQLIQSGYPPSISEALVRILIWGRPNSRVTSRHLERRSAEFEEK